MPPSPPSVAGSTPAHRACQTARPSVLTELLPRKSPAAFGLRSAFACPESERLPRLPAVSSESTHLGCQTARPSGVTISVAVGKNITLNHSKKGEKVPKAVPKVTTCRENAEIATRE